MLPIYTNIVMSKYPTGRVKLPVLYTYIHIYASDVYNDIHEISH